MDSRPTELGITGAGIVSQPELGCAAAQAPRNQADNMRLAGLSLGDKSAGRTNRLIGDRVYAG